jgi:hypothetical protein
MSSSLAPALTALHTCYEAQRSTYATPAQESRRQRQAVEAPLRKRVGTPNRQLSGQIEHELGLGGRQRTRTSGLLHVKHFRLSAVLGAWRARAKSTQLYGQPPQPTRAWAPLDGLGIGGVCRDPAADPGRFAACPDGMDPRLELGRAQHLRQADGSSVEGTDGATVRDGPPMGGPSRPPRPDQGDRQYDLSVGLRPMPERSREGWRSVPHSMRTNWPGWFFAELVHSDGDAIALQH